MRSYLLFVPLALAACNDGGSGPDATPPIDARAPDFSCADEVFPDPVPDPIVLSGEVFQPGLTGSAQDAPVAMATVRAWDLQRINLITFASSGEDGRYAIELPTGGDPLNTVFEVTAPLMIDSLAWLPTAVFEERDDIDVALFTDQHIDAIMNFSGITPDTSKGVLVVKLFDCQGFPIEGATVTIDPPPLDTLYVASNGLPSYQPKTSSQGSAILLDVERGSVLINAELDGVALRPNTVFVERIGAAITTAALVP